MKNEKGNALFIVFIALGLIASLTFVVKQSSQGSANLDRETANLVASDLIQMGSKVQYGLKRFMLAHELDITEVSFEDSAKGINGDNSNCADNTCNLFSLSGGKVNPPLLPAEAIDVAYTTCSTGTGVYNGQRKYYIMVASVQDVGTDLSDILLYYCGVRSDVCEAINIKQGLRAKGDSPIVNGHGSLGASQYASFSGDMSIIPTTEAGRFGSLDSRLNGARVFCSEDNSASFGNFFYTVIHER